MVTITRFAPSPTGFLHLGHVYSASLARRRAREDGGKFLLRIEDIDVTRCRPEFEEAIYEDLAWLGLDWDAPVRRQSDHLDDYAALLEKLSDRDLIYPCFCTRKEIAAEIARSNTAPHGPEGPAYPGTCRNMTDAERQSRFARGDAYALRLNMVNAVASVDLAALRFEEIGKGFILCDPLPFGDIVLARKETPASYHLTVTFDDAIQNVNHVIRGQDLFPSTHIHRLLQALLDLPTPAYFHHGLISDNKGRRLSKRDKDATIKSLREYGYRPEEVLKMVDYG
ncbi:tRNA glutamyl-Q(34) synthetase GluQRS [Sneathiella chungangensis]|uniref:tRNA glutamyl-Q(34) synthetase GluQRS n=1 Tax=Sneathiella chungangensis TaxID=1418234 RepID=A0A845MMM2_9PROT|nr:tRNA glutamyl-Q(34) synthetase GluQRS [Sneathiella chungangensis]MZR24270.1 tRNA glutamyl-Q(34) synthetase GluQRS [Sneathiella chungangensis]